MSLREKTLSGFVWALSNQFSRQGIAFVISIILARLLMPADFGLIGMITVFTTLAQSLIDSGLTSSLMRKPDADHLDFSTVFYTNLAGSILLYFLLFFCAPFIAKFYNQEILTSLIRILSLSFIINAFSNVQTTLLTKTLKFKAQMLINVPSLILGGIVGVSMAYMNYGVWSIVGMQLSSSLIATLQLWIKSKWSPGLKFSILRLKEHYKFGLNLMFSGILDSIFSNIIPIVIGRFFSPVQVGFYTRAMSLKQMPVANISSALNKVTYPVFASVQDDDVRLKSAYKQVMQQVLFWIAPILIGMAVLSEPLIRLLFTEKWLPAVPYFQILCVEGILYPLCAYNLNILKVKGRSDLYLRLELIKKLIVVACLAVVFLHNIYALLYMQVAFSVIAFFINSYYSGKFLGYSSLQQIKDILPTLLAALSMGMVAYLVLQLLKGVPDVVQLFVPAIISIVWYFIVCNLFRFDSLISFNQIVLKRVRQRI